MDFANWNAERQKLKDEIFRELREQRDRKSEKSVTGSFVINPQEINGFKSYGPITFDTTFLSAPHLSFNQILSVPDRPYLVHTYTVRWVVTQGAVAGFYLGVYPVVSAPEQLSKHVITWRATGTARLYSNENKLESWQFGYDRSDLGHLTGDSY